MFRSRRPDASAGSARRAAAPAPARRGERRRGPASVARRGRRSAEREAAGDQRGQHAPGVRSSCAPARAPKSTSGAAEASASGRSCGRRQSHTSPSSDEHGARAQEREQLRRRRSSGGESEAVLACWLEAKSSEIHSCVISQTTFGTSRPTAIRTPNAASRRSSRSRRQSAQPARKASERHDDRVLRLEPDAAPEPEQQPLARLAAHDQARRGQQRERGGRELEERRVEEHRAAEGVGRHDPGGRRPAPAAGGPPRARARSRPTATAADDGQQRGEQPQR